MNLVPSVSSLGFAELKTLEQIYFCTLLIFVIFWFCVDYRAKFHRDCASKVPPSCGLPDELVDKILNQISSFSKDSGLSVLSLVANA